MFDIAANGGGPVTLDYRLSGYLPAQRHVDAPWEDFVWAPDVALLLVDPEVTRVDSGATIAQVARGAP